MREDEQCLKAEFVNSIYVNREYHEKHSHYLHSHRDELEFLYIDDGNGMYYVNKREYIVNAGNLVICNAGITHGESPLRKNQMISYCCAIKELKLEGLPENAVFSGDQNPVLYFPGDVVSHIMKAIYGLSKQPGGG